jgi:hypothetical protein
MFEDWMAPAKVKQALEQVRTIRSLLHDHIKETATLPDVIIVGVTEWDRMAEKFTSTIKINDINVEVDHRFKNFVGFGKRL